MSPKAACESLAKCVCFSRMVIARLLKKSVAPPLQLKGTAPPLSGSYTGKHVNEFV